MLPRIRNDEHLFRSPSLMLTRRILKNLTMNSGPFMTISETALPEASREDIFTSIWWVNLAR